MVSAILQVLTGEHAGRTFLLEGQMIIGRDATSHIRINDRSISRKHASIEQRPDGFYVVDLGSQNGTLLNGAPVKEAVLPAACKLQFGTVQAEFSLVQENVGAGAPAAPSTLPAQRPPAGDSGWQNLAPGQSASLDDVFTAPKSLEEIDRRERDKQAEAHRRVADLMYAGLMILIVAAGVLIYMSLGKSTNVRRPVVILEQGQERLIAFPGIRGEALLGIEKPIASVTQDDEYPWLLNVKASDVGETKATVHTSAGLLGVLTIIIKGKVQDADSDRVRGRSDDERLQLAQSMLTQGDQLAKDSLWQALQFYRRAEDVCRPIRGAPETRKIAASKARSLDDQIARKATQLMQDARSARRAGRTVDAVRCLNEICQLIPDPNDKRHQRVKIILYMEYPELMRPASRK